MNISLDEGGVVINLNNNYLLFELPCIWNVKTENGRSLGIDLSSKVRWFTATEVNNFNEIEIVVLGFSLTWRKYVR